jgi:murein tripeptide amidase MpaA
MLKNNVLALAFGLLALVGAVNAQEKYSKVKIPITSEEIRRRVLDRVEADHYLYEGNSMIIVLDQEELQRLKTSGVPYKVVVEDVVKYTIELNKKASRSIDIASSGKAAFQYTGKRVSTIIPTPTLFGTGGSLRLGASNGPGYFTYSEMLAKMQALQTSYPTLFKVISIGTSAEGRIIYGVKISDNVQEDEDEAEVLYTALQHAREAIGGTSMIFFMQFLAENYNNDAKVRTLLDNREIFIIPCVNPDGYEYNYDGVDNPASGGGLWRKNRRLIAGSTYGVDLNRNYGVDWGNCAGATTSCGSSLPSADTYFGPSKFSEPETQAIRDFVYSRNFTAAIDQHCFGPYFSLPFGRPSLHTMSSSDQKFYTHIPALMGMYNCHRAGNSPETVNYEVAGGIKDWLLMGDVGVGTKGKIYGMTGEAGGGDYWAPTSQIIQLCKENCFQNIQLAFAAGDYVDLQDVSDIDVRAMAGNFGYTIRRIGLNNGPVSISIAPITNIQSVGDPITTSLANYYDSYSGNISYTLNPSIKNGQLIQFAWKIEAGGMILYDTVTKIYNALPLLYDNMEGTLSTNWTAVGDTKNSESWTLTTSKAFAGTKSMTESPSGNYPSNTERLITLNDPLNLSDATAAYLSFWVWHRSENCRDKLQVQVSTGARNAPWVPLSGTHTVMENDGSGSLGGQPALTGIRENWTREIIDLSAYKGIGTVELRFAFTSDGDASGFAYEKDDGFYIDEVKVIKSTSVLTSLPVNFVNFSGRLLEDNTVKLWWEAYADDQHDHFEIERSTDGTTFTKIGEVNRLPPYQFIDISPALGHNYYRIRQFDKDGKYSYTKVIIVSVKHHISVLLYPNPVKEELQISLKSQKSEAVRVRITDLQGRELFSKSLTPSASTNVLKVDMRSWMPELYILILYDSSGGVISTQKVIKH